MISTSLIAHPALPPAASWQLSVKVDRQPGLLTLDYRLSGDLRRLRIPAAAEPERTDGLWEHSCFEAFLRKPDADAYQEYNLSPSSAWAHYRFSGYRQALPLQASSAPHIHCAVQDDCLTLNAKLELLDEQPVLLGLTAVLEDNNGTLSYWALHHPCEKPDFHHPDSYVLELDAG